MAPTPPSTQIHSLPPTPSVDPRWLLKVVAAVVAVGVLCAYLTLCAVFFVEQWQLVLHPSRTLSATPATLGLKFQAVRFSDDRSGQPQLTGWWIPGNLPHDLPTTPTALVLHGETGTMAEALPAAKALHNVGLNVLLFDYRGYGASGGKHPTQQRMQTDAEAALQYLTETRRIAPGGIVVYGTHLGASLAVALCGRHSQLPALVLQSADGDTESRVQRDPRTRGLPLSLLFHQRFALADPLHRLQTPKLLVSYTDGPPPEEAQRAADPKTTVELPRNAADGVLAAVLRRFLDSYLPHPPSPL